MVPEKDLERLIKKLEAKKRNKFFMNTKDMENSVRVKKACDAIMSSVIKELEQMIKKYSGSTEQDIPKEVN